MSTSINLYWLAATAQAAYADLVNATSRDHVDRLWTGTDGNPLMSQRQAEAFVGWGFGCFFDKEALQKKLADLFLKSRSRRKVNNNSMVCEECQLGNYFYS